MKSTLTKTAAVLAGVLATEVGANTPKPSAALIHYEHGSQPTFTGPEDLFSGDVHVEVLFPTNETAQYSGAYVTFAPSARTAWHSHPAGQHMVVTEGTALTATRDGHVVRFTEGESVWCPTDVDHWHGATPDAAMTHLVVTGSKDGENVVWKDKVDDESYLKAVASSEPESVEFDALNALYQQIIPVSAFAAKGDVASLNKALNTALDNGTTVSQLRETLIHLYPYVGFPRALNALGALMTVVDERKAAGKKDAEGEAPSAIPAAESSQAIGEQVQTELVGRPVAGPLFDFAPGINTYLQSHLFGDVFARGVLSREDREIVTVSALATLEGAESQLGSHIGIATNTGVTEAQLEELGALLQAQVGRSAGQKVSTALDNFRAQQ